MPSSGTDDDRRKYLELIQGVITRLAGNSFSIKGWAVALVAVLGGFAAKDADARLAWTLLFPALCLWGLDAYYLRREKLYRKLYEKAVANDAAIPLFSMDTTLFESDVKGIGNAAWSPSVRWLHLPILIFVIIVIAWSAFTPPKPDTATPHIRPAAATGDAVAKPN